MSRCSRGRRGTTIAELMVVMVVLGLLMTLLASVIAPLMRSQNRSQAKLDTVQSAATALYRIQRDLRQTYYLGTYACTVGASATCSQPTSFDTTRTAIAFPTSYLGGTGQYQLQSGFPKWTGIMVYWVDAAGNLSWAFDTPTGYTPPNSSPTAIQAAQAVTDATTGVASATRVAENIRQLVVAIPGQTNIIQLQMLAQSTENGSANQTTYRSDVLARK